MAKIFHGGVKLEEEEDDAALKKSYLKKIPFFLCFKLNL